MLSIVGGVEVAPQWPAVQHSWNRFDRGYKRSAGSAGTLTPAVDSGSFDGTTGVGGDLYVADAYVLSGLVVDLKISEIVDAGQYVVSALLPEAIFV
jgi:hypothetical protein